MNNNILHFVKRLQAEDISERITLFKLFSGFLFAFALYYFAFLFVDVSAPINEFYSIKLTNSVIALVLATISVILIILFVGKKSDVNH